MDAGTVDAGTVDAGTVPLARDSAAASAICVCFILYKKHIFQKGFDRVLTNVLSTDQSSGRRGAKRC